MGYGRYNKIRKMDISNGPGVRISVFMQGCAFNCKDCFNPETHDFNGGKEFTAATIDRVLELCKSDYIEGLSILGGEPLHPNNILGTTKLAQVFKEKFPKKTLWIWTGFLFDEHIRPNRIYADLLPYIDVIVDGQFKTELSNPMLKYKGSANQRVINVQQSIKHNQIVLWEDEEN